MSKPRARCRKCGGDKGPGRCLPCRRAYLREWAGRNREQRAAQARRRYEGNPLVGELSRARNYRWREENRAHYLELKREQSRRYRERHRAA